MNIPMTKEQKDWIDNASIFELLFRWRFKPAGDPIFQGETGTYYSDVMFRKRDEDNAAWVSASKTMGW